MHWFTRFEVHMRAQEKMRKRLSNLTDKNREIPTNRPPLMLVYLLCVPVLLLLIGWITGIHALSVIALATPLGLLIGGFLLVRK